MDNHPPLGKLLIAAGEKLLQPNKNIDVHFFTETRKIPYFPQGYSFAGVRFFPTLLASLSAILFFLILFELTGYPFLSFIFTGLYLFENANIVHSRGALLDGVEIFFILLLFTLFVFASRSREKILSQKWFIFMGLAFGLAISTKLSGLVFFCLPLFLVVKNAQNHKGKNYLTKIWKTYFLQLGIFLLTGFMTFFIVYCIHFSLTGKIVNNYYSASNEYKLLIKQGQTMNLLTFPLQLKEHLLYILFFEKNVSKLSKSDLGISGSLPTSWPFGIKSIEYRSETDNETGNYLYLQGNPVIWMFGLASLIITSIVIFSVIVFKNKIRNKTIYFFLVLLLILYFGYMGAMMTLSRVMFLYLYFIPLILCLFMGVLLIVYFFENELKKRNPWIYFACIAYIAIVFLSYIFFSPFTYYLTLTRDQFLQRSLFGFWKLKPII